MLAVERCKALTPERNPRVYDASTPVSTNVAVKNLPYSCTDESIRALLVGVLTPNMVARAAHLEHIPDPRVHATLPSP